MNFFHFSAPSLNSDLLNIDWTAQTATEIYNRSRALEAFGALITSWVDLDLKVFLKSAIHPKIGETFKLDECFPSAEPGRTVFVTKQDKSGKKNQLRFIFTKASRGWVAFHSYQMSGKGYKLPVDFHNGFMAKFEPKKTKRVVPLSDDEFIIFSDASNLFMK